MGAAPAAGAGRRDGFDTAMLTSRGCSAARQSIPNEA
jgi:hypothetical protein